MRSLLKPILFVLCAAAMVFFTQCNKDRIELEKNEYDSMNDYFDSKKQEEQDFVIDTLGTCPVTGNQGTRICPSITAVMHSNGDSVKYPYNMHLIELYTVKDMIYYWMSDLGGNLVISSKGVIRLRATKDNDALSMRASGTWNIEEPDASPVSGQSIYYSTDGSNWTTSSQSFTTSAYGYVGNSSQLSWISNATAPSISSSRKSITFTSDTDVLTNVATFIYLPNLDALVQVNNQTSIALPVGEDIEIILMGIRSNGDLYHYYKETTVSASSNEYKVELTKISDANLTSILDGLD